MLQIDRFRLYTPAPWTFLAREEPEKQELQRGITRQRYGRFGRSHRHLAGNFALFPVVGTLTAQDSVFRPRFCRGTRDDGDFPLYTRLKRGDRAQRFPSRTAPDKGRSQQRRRVRRRGGQHLVRRFKLYAFVVFFGEKATFFQFLCPWYPGDDG